MTYRYSSPELMLETVVSDTPVIDGRSGRVTPDKRSCFSSLFFDAGNLRGNDPAGAGAEPPMLAQQP